MWSRISDDRYLLVALILAGLLVGHGLWWGWVECWNPDQMAMRPVSLPFLAPEWFLKPPFHTYFNFFLSFVPFKAAEKALEVLTNRPQDFSVAMLWWSRLLQLSLFAAMVYCSYRIGERSSGKWAGRVIALSVATSAGFVLQGHFLTADIPVTFWMLAAFWFAQSIALTGKMRAYVLAGLLTGVATATKYNGLAVGLAIPLFHLFVTPRLPLLKLPVDRRFLISMAMVVVGFVIANPHAVIDFQRFADDFVYNWVTTPIYEGEIGRQSYLQFFARAVEVVGYPMAALLAFGTLVTAAQLKRAAAAERATTVAALGVFLLYLYQFGDFPRLEVRFVIAALPFLFIAAAPALARIVERYRTVAGTVFTAIIGYNIVASTLVGHRFAHDPRMAAQAWVAANIPDGARVESTSYAPRWNKYPGVTIEDLRAPSISGRKQLFSNLLASKPNLLAKLNEFESEGNFGWYTPEALASRAPEYIALNSLFYDRFMSGSMADLHPEMRSYFVGLLNGALGYSVAFDQASSPAPDWLYPREILFVDNRIVILKRNAEP
ncbi:MAG: ArnT family glycosyltransferase [Burkholderiaceae bacterium]